MKRIAAATSVTVLFGAMAGLLPASAAGNSVAVPAKGPAQASTAWTDTVPVSVDEPTLGTCSQRALPAPGKHTFAVTVPAGAYNIVNATMTLAIDSAPRLNGDFIELLDPSGHSAGHDGQKPQMRVTVTNPVAGTWTAVVCQFIPDDPSNGHPYSAHVTITTKCKGKSPCPAPPKKGKKH